MTHIDSGGVICLILVHCHLFLMGFESKSPPNKSSPLTGEAENILNSRWMFVYEQKLRHAEREGQAGEHTESMCWASLHICQSWSKPHLLLTTTYQRGRGSEAALRFRLCSHRLSSHWSGRLLCRCCLFFPSPSLSTLTSPQRSLIIPAVILKRCGRETALPPNKPFGQSLTLWVLGINGREHSLCHQAAGIPLCVK